MNETPSRPASELIDDAAALARALVAMGMTEVKITLNTWAQITNVHIEAERNIS